MKNKMLIIGLMIVTIDNKCFGAAQAPDYAPFVSDYFLHCRPCVKDGIGKSQLIARIGEIRQTCLCTKYVFDAVRLAIDRDRRAQYSLQEVAESPFAPGGSCELVMDDGDPYPKGVLSGVRWQNNLEGFLEVEVRTLIPTEHRRMKSFPEFCEGALDRADEVLTEVSEVVVVCGDRAQLRVGRKHHMKIAVPLFKVLLECPVRDQRAAGESVGVARQSTGLGVFVGFQ